MGEQKAEGKNRNRKKLSPAGSFFGKLAVIVVVIVVLHMFIFGAGRISGNYMYPSVRDGDFCIFYQLDQYHVGDVVQYEDPSGKRRIGRIIAMEGTFNMTKGHVPEINDMELSEDVVYETVKGSYPLPAKIHDGEYWIMNDFRSNTEDSRDYGPIEKKKLHGKILFLFRRRGF